MHKTTAAIAGIALAAGLAACSAERGFEEYPDFNSDGQIACFDKNGRFREWDDDDCRDDGLYTKAELRRYRLEQSRKSVAPLRTSGGMRTAGPVKPATPGKVYNNPPARKK